MLGLAGATPPVPDAERPAWLDNIHRQLDHAVFAAYDWSPTMTDDQLLAALLDLNLRRAAEAPAI